MSTRNCNVRFAENNFAEQTSGSISYSSELASFPMTNALNKFRSKVWKPSGRFEITSSNNKIYINDGTDKTITLTVADYDTPALMASHIQTQLNASSSNWTVSYSTTTYKFTLSNTSSVTLRLATTTSAAWDTIGYTGTSNRTGTSFLADEQRNHTSEYIEFDFGYNASITFFACIGLLSENFSITNAATITLKANNISSWTSPPLSLTITRDDDGIFRFLDDIADTGFRYWRFEWIDRLNPLGPEGTSIGHIYLGDYTYLSNRNVSNRIKYQNTDPSDISESESGALYFDKKTKFFEIDNLSLQYLTQTDRDTMQALFDKLGKTTPFYISLDPLERISSLTNFTKYVVFDSVPTFNHVISDKFTMDFTVKEVL